MGHKKAVRTSGFNIISDLCGGCQASIDEPSKGIPFANKSAFIALKLYVT